MPRKMQLYNVIIDFILQLTTGLLSAVDSLMMTVQDSTISLTWTVPFTLDIAAVDPDITYCVCVVNSTSSSTLHSQCGITKTEFSFSIPPDTACHNYMFTFTVTPVNGVGNGTSLIYYHHLQGDTTMSCTCMLQQLYLRTTCMYAPNDDNYYVVINSWSSIMINW